MIKDSPHLKKQIRYVRVNGRLIASLIDMTLAFLLLTPLFNLVWFLMHGEMSTQQIAHQALEAAKSEGHSPEYIGKHFMELPQIQTFLQAGGLIDVMVYSAIQIGTVMVAIILFLAYRSATPGKMLLSMRVVDADTFEPISVKQAIIRTLSYVISAAPLFIGVFWAVFSKRKQTWHDKIANTVVIKR